VAAADVRVEARWAIAADEHVFAPGELGERVERTTIGGEARGERGAVPLCEVGERARVGVRDQRLDARGVGSKEVSGVLAGVDAPAVR
jgi:hypothetical protein